MRTRNHGAVSWDDARLDRGVELTALAAKADPVADFYKGKTVTIQVGTAPGGGYDTTARIFAQNFGRHIPGNPNVVVQNVPGSGGMKEANALYNIEPKDGTVLGSIFPPTSFWSRSTNKQARYGSLKFGLDRQHGRRCRHAAYGKVGRGRQEF